ncbi:hypothetical protein [Paenibacillus woosongensis]|uniref:hypothetical protein n=1 Tax=Paenibacillus woosongensis TaxID=307580 RepID=UPI0018C2641B|nr:hypothetical protein [Paenibacillus woosongensis]
MDTTNGQTTYVMAGDSPAFFVVVQIPDPFPLKIDDKKGGGYEHSKFKSLS